MFKRPSSRGHTRHKQINLNLVPILDAMVTLIAFMLYTMSFFALVFIESPFPQVTASDAQKSLTEKPLQLTLTIREKEIEIWSPFERIPPKKIPNTADGQMDIKAMHDVLRQVKAQFPNETSVVLVPYSGASYDQLIMAMDTMRSVDPTDPAIYAKNPQTGTDELVKTLFPNIIFGNLLGDE